MNRKAITLLAIAVVILTAIIIAILWRPPGAGKRDLALELRECLPKSDTTSRDRCLELLKLITNYDECVAAGFSIMKSNPPQCATPDGRNFTENK
ncbi:MAG: hypothetical protein LiPW15_642 [Parcubacteria group bacterium LiPW_15]|nr:MAG: hypothetical protein LiPW15_642 [Parcubacteria group bacterium LiPW_15]